MATLHYSEQYSTLPHTDVVIEPFPSFNDILAISQQGVQFRTSDDIDAGGFFFS